MNKKIVNNSVLGVWVFTILLGLGITSNSFANTVPHGYFNIQKILPNNWEIDGSVDLHDKIQKALDTHSMVYFPGSNDPDNPVIYPTTTKLKTQKNARILFGANARFLRLPSKRSLLYLNDGARAINVIIDGNKYAHWPEFKNLGKTDAGIQIRNNCVLKNCVVFNNPGIGFYSYGSYNRIYNCRAENLGYIDVKFKRDFYQGKWDKWSADGFYFRGTGNLIKDCQAYDCFRWDYTSPHSGSRQNTYVDCRGGDVNWRTYGFIDIETAEPNNRLIRCTSPNSRIAIAGSPGTEVIDCVATEIRGFGRRRKDSKRKYGINFVRPRIVGCTTTNGGIIIGGKSTKTKAKTGAVSPIVINNIMYKHKLGPSSSHSNWSFVVKSLDGHGVVANNILYEYAKKENGKIKRGPGMHLEHIRGHNNQVIYGNWDTLKLAKPKLKYGYIGKEIRKKLSKKYPEKFK